MPLNNRPHANAGTQGDSTVLSSFHSFPDVVFVVSSQGIILDANQAFASQFNKTPDDFFGLNVFDFLPPEAGTARMTMLQEAVLTSRPITFDDDDHGKLIRSTIYPYKSSEGNVDRFLIIEQDITGIGRLLKKEQLFSQQIIESIPGTFYLLDANGKFVAWNDRVRDKSFGVSEEEMPETFILDIIHPEDRDRARKVMGDILNNNAEVTEEFRVVLQGSSDIRWRLMNAKRIMIDGSPYIIGTGIDITKQKLAEEALQKSEERFRTLFHSQSAIQALLDPDTGKVLDVNQKAVEWYGWTAEELKQMYTRDINTLSQEEIINSLQTVDAGQHNKFMGRHRRADGSVRDVEIYRNRIDLDGKAVIHVITHDITERKLNENALKRSEERFRVMFEKHSAVMLVIDPDTGNIIDANQAAEDYYGWPGEELRKMQIQQINTLTPKEVIEAMQHSRSTAKKHFSFRHRRADGSLRDVEVYSNPIQIDGKVLFYSIIHDITQRLHAEDLQRKSEKQLEKKYQTLIAASPDAIITTDLEGIISSVSDVGLEIFGTNNKSEIIGQPFSTIVYQDNIAIISEIFDITLHEGLIQNREILLKKKNNTVYSAEISAALIQDHNGTPSSYMMIIRNISQRKIIERELFHAKRLISLGEMASGIAHEIYQPINNIGLVVDKLLMNASKNDWSCKKEIKTTSDKIFENIIRVQTIIDNIRSFSSTDNNYISSVVNINKSISNALLMVSEQCKHRSILLEFKPEAERFTVTGNIYKFEQVILNLIRNSIDALEERKLISQSAFEMKIQIRLFHDNGSVMVSVEDTGIGISEKHIEYIMHPFYTTKESGKGTGLGLSISYGIIKEMNGDIKIESTPMNRTLVVITLPKKKAVNGGTTEF